MACWVVLSLLKRPSGGRTSGWADTLTSGASAEPLPGARTPARPRLVPLLTSLVGSGSQAARRGLGKEGRQGGLEAGSSRAVGWPSRPRQGWHLPNSPGPPPAGRAECGAGPERSCASPTPPGPRLGTSFPWEPCVFPTHRRVLGRVRVVSGSLTVLSEDRARGHTQSFRASDSSPPVAWPLQSAVSDILVSLGWGGRGRSQSQPAGRPRGRD